MTEIKAGDTAKLHYALTDSQCNACGSHLEWLPDFGDISKPRYLSNHCNYQYIIYIDDVKLDVIKTPDKEEPLQTKREREPRAILMAEEKKEEKQSESKVSET